MLRSLLVLLSIFAFFLVACTPPEPPRVTPVMQKEIDSLFKDAIVEVKKETDSLCLILTQDIIESVKDSIIQVRLEERKKRLGF